jgi:hypothetical protein
MPVVRYEIEAQNPAQRIADAVGVEGEVRDSFGDVYNFVPDRVELRGNILVLELRESDLHQSGDHKGVAEVVTLALSRVEGAQLKIRRVLPSDE